MDFFSGLYRFTWKKTGQLASAALEPPIASRAPKKGLPLFPWKAPCPRMVEPHCQGGSPRRTCHWLLHCNTFQECVCAHLSGGGSATWWYLGGVPACSSWNHWICPACAWCASYHKGWVSRQAEGRRNRWSQPGFAPGAIRGLLCGRQLSRTHYLKNKTKCYD